MELRRPLVPRPAWSLSQALSRREGAGPSRSPLTGRRAARGRGRPGTCARGRSACQLTGAPLPHTPSVTRPDPALAPGRRPCGRGHTYPLLAPVIVFTCGSLLSHGGGGGLRIQKGRQREPASVVWFRGQVFDGQLSIIQEFPLKQVHMSSVILKTMVFFKY